MRPGFWFILLFIGTTLFSQKDALKRSNDFINEGDYRSALMQLNEIPNIEFSAPLLFKRAKCYYEINELDKALAELSKAESIGYKNEEALYYKGRILHHKGNFTQAINSYKEYLKKIDPEHPKRQDTRDHLRHAGAALDILYIEPMATIRNAGPSINSRYDDQNLVQSPGNNDKYYFSSNRPDKNQKVAAYLSKSYSIDASSDVNIYATEKGDNEWVSAKKLGDRNINTYKDDYLVDFSIDGSSLYVRRGNEAKELLAQSTSTDMKRRVKALFDIVQEDEYLHFFNDSTVIFSSNRLEGRGGYDLYVTAYVNDTWLHPKNLGREINTAYDEISPYLTNDGGQLYFSSNRSFSVGGFDVFSARYLFEQRQWTRPKNVGLPVNSPGNDIHFRLSDDGLIGTYTSDRRDGYGLKDLYFAYLNEKSEHQTFTVRDLSFVDYPDFYLKKIENNPVVIDAAEKKPVDIVQPKIPTRVIPSAVSLGPRKIELPILFPDQGGELLTKENFLKIEQLIETIGGISRYSGLEVMSFSDQEGIAEYNLFLSIKNAEKIEKALIERGMKSDKIHLKGFGNFLPMIKPSVVDNEVRHLNNRIEFKINLPDDNLMVVNETVDINNSYLNKGYDIFRTLIDNAIRTKFRLLQ